MSTESALLVKSYFSVFSMRKKCIISSKKNSTNTTTTPVKKRKIKEKTKGMEREIQTDKQRKKQRGKQTEKKNCPSFFRCQYILMLFPCHEIINFYPSFSASFPFLTFMIKVVDVVVTVIVQLYHFIYILPSFTMKTLCDRKTTWVKQWHPLLCYVLHHP